MEHLVPETALQQQFDDLEAGFARCARFAQRAQYVFGGRAVVMRVAGDDLARRISRPFDHLRRETLPGEPVRLDVRLWDETETGIAVSPPRPAVHDPDGITEVAESGRFVQHRTAHGTVSLDRKTARIVGAFAPTAASDVYQRGKPLARLLAEWYADQGVSLMHAALVARGDHGVLLAGKGGSGKSTSALVCTRAGLDFLGEDYAGLQFLPDGRVVGHSAYSSVFLDPAAMARFSELRPHTVESRDPAEPKGVTLLSDVWPDRLRTDVTVRAVALCRVTSGDASRVRQATRARALLAVGPSSLLQIHGRRRDSLDRLARLVESVPCFHLDLGRNLEGVPAAVDDLLSRAVLR
jgi:hypothetical protein